MGCKVCKEFNDDMKVEVKIYDALLVAEKESSFPPLLDKTWTQL